MFKLFNKKKRYFKRIIKDAQSLVWETEFKKFTVLQQREDIRRQYDQSQQALEQITPQFEAKPNDKKIEEEKLQIEKKADELKQLLDAVDATLDGGPPSEIHKNGVSEGLNQELQNKVNRINSVKAFIEYNC